MGRNEGKSHRHFRLRTGELTSCTGGLAGNAPEGSHLLCGLGRSSVWAKVEGRGEILILGCTDLTCIGDHLRKVLAPHIKIIDAAREVARTAEKVLQKMGWRRLGRREGSSSVYESTEGPKQLRDFAERVFNIKIGAINVCKNLAYR